MLYILNLQYGTFVSPFWQCELLTEHRQHAPHRPHHTLGCCSFRNKHIVCGAQRGKVAKDSRCKKSISGSDRLGIVWTICATIYSRQL